nr:AAC_HP1_G0023180.mRNA.1.CDS.1 [Saccharomyces cerevisiae]
MYSRKSLSLISKCGQLSRLNAQAALQARRHLSIHEYRSAQLLREYGIGTPEGFPAFTPEEAFEAAKKLNTNKLVIKAQALTGGRGKGHFDTGYKSGVHMIESPQQAEDVAKEMLNHNLITKQTGIAGKPVSAVYIVKRVDTKHEAYLSILMDRQTKKPMIIASSQGGMNIEKVAERTPDAIKKFSIETSKGLSPQMAKDVAKSLGFSPDAQDEAAKAVSNLYKIFMERDATQVEINPLSEIEHDPTHKIMCTDAKFGFDDNASFRQEKIYSWRDLSQEDPDENVDAIFVNIFGGIVRCDYVALGLVEAARELEVRVPIVARLQGTKVEEGRDIINKSGVKIYLFDELDPAAKKVVELTQN